MTNIINENLQEVRILLVQTEVVGYVIFELVKCPTMEDWTLINLSTFNKVGQLVNSINWSTM